jgi:tripartite-type tricarboxylate transporter receptor subunit TctC
MRSSTYLCRSFVLQAAVAAAVVPLALGGATAFGQQYPAKTVRVIVPFAPGGGSDISARRFSAKLSQVLGQQFVVDNRGGAAGLIGMELTAKSPPDGYTIMIMSGSFSATSATRQPAFDPIHNIVPVIEFGITPFILTVHPSLPVKSTQQLIALARAKPGDLTYANTGIGGMTHLATEYFAAEAKISMVGVPYKSTGAGMADLLSGQVPIICGSLLPIVPHLKTGKLRGLGVSTLKRWYSLPDLPAVSETVPGFDVVLWFGTMVPRGTPQPIVDRLNTALNDILKMEDVKESLEREGMQATGGTPEAFGKRIRTDYDRWVKLVKTANIVIK